MRMLSKLIEDLNLRVVNFKDFEVKGIAHHSGDVCNSYIFVAITGFKTDGRNYINDAMKRGARAILVEDAVDLPIVQIITDDTRRTMAELAVRLYENVLDKIYLIGITGTNGKTTTAYLIRSILKKAFIGCGIIGSVEYDLGSGVVKSTHTTPEIVDIMKMLESMVENGLRYAVIEATSHGLKLKRIYGLKFPIRIFTNISRDHLDFHGDFVDYQRTKLSFFERLDRETLAIINGDDPFSSEILRVTQARVITYGVEHGNVKAVKIKTSNAGLEFNIVKEDAVYPIKMRLVGRHNIYNSLAAFISASELGIEPDIIIQSFYEQRYIPGRLMPVDNDRELKIYIDYAHTPDALQKVLKSVREFAKGRIVVVFGCGGDRDQGKRPEMGRIVSELADLAIVTSDNPRSEDPLKIIDDIIKGIPGDNFIVEPDRHEAIKIGIRMMGSNDTLIIAGKGHEDYQIIKDKRLPFNDAKVVEEILGCTI